MNNNSKRAQTRTAAPKKPVALKPMPQKLVPQRSSQVTFTLDKRKVVFGVIILLIIANIVIFSLINRHSVPEIKTPSQVEEESRLDFAEKYEEKFDRYSVASSDYKRGALVLVNSDVKFDFDYTGKDIPDEEIIRVNTNIENKTFKAADNTIKLARSTVSALNLMFADFYAASGKNDVMINSAHRTYDDQKSIYDNYLVRFGADQQIAQKPGDSEHHTGYAVDFSVYPDGGRGAGTFTGEGVYSWVYDNCHRYGFIHRYPEGKTEITGISPESWHFRYVGLPHSYYIYDRGLVLEEYIKEIKMYTENVPMSVETAEGEYFVFYVKCAEGATTEFSVPKGAKCGVSGNNVDGFIVWYNCI